MATPLLGDRNFARSVILVCSHHEQGAFGLTLNRPMGEPVAAHLPDWGARVAAPAVFFAGGPVQRNIVMALARPGAIDDAEWWTAVTPEVGLVDLRQAPADLAGRLGASRLFAGYAGWGGGQLEAEIAEDAWFVLDARPGDAFCDEPETLWGDVLRRQRGRRADLAVYANFPLDPARN